MERALRLPPQAAEGGSDQALPPYPRPPPCPSSTVGWRPGSSGAQTCQASFESPGTEAGEGCTPGPARRPHSLLPEPRACLTCSHWRPHGARAGPPGAPAGPGPGPGPVGGPEPAGFAGGGLRVPWPGFTADLRASSQAPVAGPSRALARSPGSPLQHRAPLPLRGAAQPLPSR